MAELQKKLKQFAEARDWQQFHSPKNLSMALSVEASELLEHFQWLTEEQSYQLPDDTYSEVKDEMADVFMYTLLLADKLNIDLLDAAEKKYIKNEEKYPVELARGSAKKYTAYQHLRQQHQGDKQD